MYLLINLVGRTFFCSFFWICCDMPDGKGGSVKKRIGGSPDVAPGLGLGLALGLGGSGL